MREILFKAKRKDNGEWVEGYYLKTRLGGDIDPSDVIFVPFKINKGEDWGFIKVDPKTICQYIGLKDKNRNMIWENDIVKDEEACLFGTVIWLQDDYDYMGWFLDDENLVEPEMMKETMWRDCEVLGNIFDNPELLGG